MMLQPETKQRHARILIVDDEKYILDLLGKILTDNGYEVELAESAEQALEKLREQEIAVVITDIYMTGKNGIELLQEIPNVQPTTRTIVMTGRCTTDTIKAAFSAKASGFLLKPFRSVDQIVSKVERSLLLNDLCT